MSAFRDIVHLRMLCRVLQPQQTYVGVLVADGNLQHASHSVDANVDNAITRASVLDCAP